MKVVNILFYILAPVLHGIRYCNDKPAAWLEHSRELLHRPGVAVAGYVREHGDRKDLVKSIILEAEAYTVSDYPRRQFIPLAGKGRPVRDLFLVHISGYYPAHASLAQKIA